ncbi:hypothetical protein ASG52_02170 [Methylobacterium sp. Leaf456]|nr:hypothetical protein ASG52_02170 [Methylobacterium sp. Leaf456]
MSGDGDDTLRGLGGDDILSTGKGFDSVDGGAEADRWVADKSEMTTAQAMVLDLTKTGLQGTYSVRSEVTKANGTGAVRDIDMLTLTTGSGNDVIVTQAASHSDQVTTGAGSDRVKVAGGTDTVALGAIPGPPTPVTASATSTAMSASAPGLWPKATTAISGATGRTPTSPSRMSSIST